MTPKFDLRHFFLRPSFCDRGQCFTSIPALSFLERAIRAPCAAVLARAHAADIARLTTANAVRLFNLQPELA